MTSFVFVIANFTQLLHVVGVCFSGKAAQSGDNLLIIPNFTLKDSQGQTVFGLAVWQVCGPSVKCIASSKVMLDCVVFHLLILLF